jgi:hypothetical protein
VTTAAAGPPLKFQPGAGVGVGAGVGAGGGLAVVEPAATMTMLLGSSSKLPTRPAGARRSARPVNSSDCLPETSAKPPSPPCVPPRADSWPCIRVASSDQTITRPPLPASRASALTWTPAPTKVRAAFGTAALPPW